MIYIGSDNRASIGACCLNTSALAICSISLSVLSLLRELTAHNTKRLLFFVYPNTGIILSMLGEKFLFLYPTRFSGGLNSIPVNSQYPVQRAFAHSSVNSNGKFFFFASRLRPSKRVLHGSF